MKKNRIECKNNNTISFGYSYTVNNHIGNVIIITDLFASSTYYDDFATFLAKNNFNVYCLDLFAQGENVKEDGSNLGIVPDSAFRKQIEQIDTLVKQLRLSAKPTFIAADRYGSVYAQDYIQRFTEHVSKVVLISCPLNRLAWFNLFQFAKMSKPFVKRRSKSKVAMKYFSKYYNSNKDSYSVGYFFELEKGLNRLYKKKFMSKIRKDLDILLLSAKEDSFTNNGTKTNKLKSIYTKLGISNVKTNLLDSVNIKNSDSDKTVVFNEILSFLLEDITSKNII